jgi:hypothetical protein
MFMWYYNAGICFVYLSDVPIGLSVDDHFLPLSSFRKSRWFTRGWTLQELIATRVVAFLNWDWEEIGRKFDLGPLLTDVTGIQQKFLFNFEDASVAQKMSWVSDRETTRIEDLAYCMLGIFGVSMPPMYGEGSKAFVRLQLEIIKISDDESIFAWQSDLEDALKYPERGMLACHPKEFRYAGNIESYAFDQERPPYSMTNKGLQMTVPVLIHNVGSEYKKGSKILEVSLNCTRQVGKGPLVILLKQKIWADTRGRKHQTARISPDLLVTRKNTLTISPGVAFVMSTNHYKFETWRPLCGAVEHVTSLLYVAQLDTFGQPRADIDLSITIPPLAKELHCRYYTMFLSHPDLDYWHETEPFEFKITLGGVGIAALVLTSKHSNCVILLMFRILRKAPLLFMRTISENGENGWYFGKRVDGILHDCGVDTKSFGDDPGWYSNGGSVPIPNSDETLCANLDVLDCGTRQYVLNLRVEQNRPSSGLRLRQRVPTQGKRSSSIVYQILQKII